MKTNNQFRKTFRVGVAGPVGSGKTALVASLVTHLKNSCPVGVVTNDIFTAEDAEFLKKLSILPDDLIIAVKTGCCPHTAIREDISANLEAAELIESRLPAESIVLIESGGDNLTATFSYGLIDKQIFVLDIAGGDKLARKGGPGITQSDLLVINKIDLAEMVGANRVQMEEEALVARNRQPTISTSVRFETNTALVAQWVLEQRELFLESASAQAHPDI
ncbi:MAG: urease accessory protein UreG [Firmicutes bacterium]|nr:urease accessory protein UreG [Bacillota bacterium]